MRFIVIGGDRRRYSTAQTLQALGGEVVLHTPNEPETDVALHSAECAVLPYPSLNSAGCIPMPLAGHSAEPLEILDALPAGCVVAGGGLDALKSVAAQRGLFLLDYALDEPLLCANAELTAEAAQGLAVQRSDRALYGSTCLIIGFGRIGKALARRLSAAGVNLIVSARKPADLQQIRAAGWRAVHTASPEEVLCEADFVFNTVPASVLDVKAIRLLPANACLMDLASAPGGIETSAAEALGYQAFRAGGLPGRFSPVTAGRLVAQRIWNLLKERGYAL